MDETPLFAGKHHDGFRMPENFPLKQSQQKLVLCRRKKQVLQWSSSKAIATLKQL